MDVYSLKKKSQQAENMFQRNKGVSQGTSVVMLINFIFLPLPPKNVHPRLDWHGFR